jgi:ribonuclease HII
MTEERILWSRGLRHVAGIDEVGRGCLAGPVAAGAVILPRGWIPDGLRDSKTIPAEERTRLAAEIRQRAVAWAVAFVSPAVIDRINILQATLLASELAAARLAIRPDAVLLDGSLVFAGLPVHQRVLVDADRLCASVAAASIVAKVARDDLMARLDALHPGYGRADNTGYAAPGHRAALTTLGPSPVHRRTFASVAAVEQLDLFESEA